LLQQIDGCDGRLQAAENFSSLLCSSHVKSYSRRRAEPSTETLVLDQVFKSLPLLPIKGKNDNKKEKKSNNRMKLKQMKLHPWVCKPPISLGDRSIPSAQCVVGHWGYGVVTTNKSTTLSCPCCPEWEWSQQITYPEYAQGVVVILLLNWVRATPDRPFMSCKSSSQTDT
jgi:hypothetical protein